MPFITSLTTNTELTKRNINGSKWFNVFQGKDGINYEVEITEKEYGKVPIIPDGEIFKGGYSRRKFDTTDGELGETDYAIDGNMILVKVSGIYITLPIQMLSANKITTSGITEIADKLTVHNLWNQTILWN